MTKSELFCAVHAEVRRHIAAVRHTDPRRAATLRYAEIFKSTLGVRYWDAKNAAALVANFAARETFRANHPDRWY